MNKLIKKLFILSIIIFLVLIIYLIYNKNKNNEGYHPFNPYYPWYWFNFPTRTHISPTRNISLDLRGQPLNNHPRVLVHPSRHPGNYLWGIPTVYPNYPLDVNLYNNIYRHSYSYDYYYPVPKFNYNMRYSSDGNLYKIHEEKINTVPSANN